MNLKLNDLIPHKISKKTSIKHFTLKLAAFVLSEVLWVTCVYGQSGSAYTGLFIDTNKAVLQGLDKTTARVSTFELNINERGTFGTLIIKVRACRKRPPTEPPESAAYIEVLDKKIGEQPTRLFAGWMFASSPTLNSLEHPVYDVWVLKCSGSKT
tara:strand:- start:1630 stop:2094 length:465 start_codon:yes stop_codon:yes gene_type:complete